jgi:hypothetical protein
MDCNRVTVTVRCRERTSLSSDSQDEIGSPYGFNPVWFKTFIP